MEFLDDLQQQRESKTRPKTQPEAQLPSPARPAREIPQSPGSWDDLLASVNVDEPEETAPQETQSRGRRKDKAGGQSFTPAQRIVLGILFLGVLASWITVIVLIKGSIRNAANADRALATSMAAEATIVSEKASLTAETIPAAPTEPAEPAAPAETMPTVVPTSTATLIPTGPVATIYDEQIRKDPDNVDLYIRRGGVYLAAGAYQAALEDFRHAQELNADRAEIYQGYGWTYYALFRWGEAEAAFDKAIDLDPELADAYFGRGKINYYRGNYKPASTNFDAAADIDPQKAEYEAWLAMSAAQSDDGPEALGAATRAISASTRPDAQDLSIVYVARAWAARVQTPESSDTPRSDAPNLDRAQEDLLHALDLGPNDFLTLNAVAEFYVSERPERLAEAEQLAAYAFNWAQNDVERAIAQQTLGRVYLLQERKADAQRVLGEAVAMASTDGEIVLAGLEEDLARAQE